MVGVYTSTVYTTATPTAKSSVTFTVLGVVASLTATSTHNQGETHH